MKKTPEGCVNGRFQPFHLGHLEYLLASVKKCEYLWIGITQPDLSTIKRCMVAQHRGKKDTNPLLYCERVKLVCAALLEAGIPRNKFGFVPFPIDEPDKLRNYVPITTVCFTTVYDKWNEEKIRRLRNYGYKVRVLWRRKRKVFSGAAVRESIADGTHAWKSMVPKSCVPCIVALNLRARLRSMV